MMWVIYTSATSGSLKTQYFGDKYNADKVERYLYYRLQIYPPMYVVKNPNFTLTIKIEKVSMKVSGNSRDLFRVGKLDYLDNNQSTFTFNFTGPDMLKFISQGLFLNLMLKTQNLLPCLVFKSSGPSIKLLHQNLSTRVTLRMWNSKSNL